MSASGYERFDQRQIDRALALSRQEYEQQQNKQRRLDVLDREQLQKALALSQKEIAPHRTVLLARQEWQKNKRQFKSQRGKSFVQQCLEFHLDRTSEELDYHLTDDDNNILTTHKRHALKVKKNNRYAVNSKEITVTFEQYPSLNQFELDDTGNLNSGSLCGYYAVANLLIFMRGEFISRKKFNTVFLPKAFKLIEAYRREKGQPLGTLDNLFQDEIEYLCSHLLSRYIPHKNASHENALHENATHKKEWIAYLPEALIPDSWRRDISRELRLQLMGLPQLISYFCKTEKTGEKGFYIVATSPHSGSHWIALKIKKTGRHAVKVTIFDSLNYWRLYLTK